MSMSTRGINRRGGIVLRVVMIAASLIVVAMMIVILLRRQHRNQEVSHRKALQVAELGLQRSLQRLSRSPSILPRNPRVEADEGWYKVETERSEVGDTTLVEVTVEGHYGRVAHTLTCVLSLSEADGDSVWVKRALK